MDHHLRSCISMVMSLQHKIERTTVRTLMKMPGALAGRLAGMVESVSREGLDPKLRLLLALGDGRKGFHELPLAQGRALYGHMIDMLDVDRQEVALTRDIRVPVEGGDMLVRLYRPKSAPTEDSPAIMFFHGGGWVKGTRQGYAFAGRAFASKGFVTVVPDYRKVPDVRFPAFVEDGAQVHRAGRLVDRAGRDIEIASHVIGAAVIKLDIDLDLGKVALRFEIGIFAGGRKHLPG